jgi:hypothetical protein
MQLRIMLESLDYKNHLDRIIVIVAGVDDGECAAKVVENYSNGIMFSLLKHHVLTTADNMDEYASIVRLGLALKVGEISRDSMFLIVHDTCEVGRLFWQLLADVEANIANTRFTMVENCEDCTFSVMSPAPMCVVKTNGEWASDAVGVVRIVRQGGQLRAETVCGKMYFFGTDKLLHETADGINDASALTNTEILAVLEEAYMWYPLCTNFNFGVATSAFLTDVVLPAFTEYFSDVKYTKDEGVGIEICQDHRLNLVNLSKGRWRFVEQHNRKMCMAPVLSYWKNHTDVYNNGVKRNISYLPALDLKKYTRLVGPLSHR